MGAILRDVPRYVGCTKYALYACAGGTVPIYILHIHSAIAGPEVEIDAGPCGVKGRRRVAHDDSWMRSG